MIRRVSLHDVGRAVLDLFMPRRCIVCSGLLALHEDHICLHCLADMPRTHFSTCSRNQMADRFNELLQRHLDTSGDFFEYSYASALFFYRSSTGYRLITQSLKYHGDIAAGRYFSKMLGRELASSWMFKDVDAIVPVPLHWSRRWSRGYNQAEIIADELSCCLGVPHRKDILVRPRRTRSQTKMSMEEKTSNVHGAFKVRKKADLRGLHHLLIVDDVFTTGATLFACYLALREHLSPDVRISVATLACVGR